MAIQPISAVSGDRLIIENQRRLEVRNEMSEYPAPPASVLAVPAETARAQANVLSMVPAMMAPTPDGIFTIGSVAVKTNATTQINSTGISSWGF